MDVNRTEGIMEIWECGCLAVMGRGQVCEVGGGTWVWK